MAQKIIFFAYEDGHQDNKDAISKASEEYNRHQKTYKIRKWEDLRVSGNIIGTRIFDQIRNCEKFACDLTYLNHNVLFELGFAIAQKKPLKIFLNHTISNSVTNYSDLKILKTIGYAKFLNAKDIAKEFQKSSTEDESLLIKKIIPEYEGIELDNDIFLINTKNKNQAAIDIEYYLHTTDKKTITNNEDEIVYQPLAWYLNAILRSKIILLHMVGNDKTDYKVTNAEYSLYAGLAYGLEKEVLMIAPSPFHAPIDYTDILVEYSSSDDCVNKAETWLNGRFKKIYEENEAKANINEIIKKDDERELNLLKLGIGYGVAENEEFSGQDVFVEIDAYSEAIKRKKAIIIGRKGSGKTEIFLRLKENLDDDRNNYNVIIKPDSDEMLSDVELSNLYNNERAKKAFLTTVWQYVVYSRIFQQIFKNRDNINLTDNEKQKIFNYYEENKEMFDCNFYGMILYISKNFKGQNITVDPSLLDKIKQKLFPMGNMINNFFENKRYQKITILADNLDTGWDSISDLGLQSLMLMCLIEYIDIINNQYKGKVAVHSVLFLRKDIFNYILRDVREPDKIMIDVFEINWERFPGQLKNVIDKRINSVLENNQDIDQIWKDYFKLKNSLNPFEIILSRIVKRPRDAIYFITRLFESAVNNNRLSVTDKDLNYALDEYTKFLYNNLIAELKAEFPMIGNILKELQKVYIGLLNQFTLIPIESFYKIIQIVLSKDDTMKLINVLMENNYLVAIIKAKNRAITNYEDLIIAANEKRFKIFRKNKILLNMRLIPFTE
jgi:hypothetical protein